jgi:hypothetical protein
MQPYFKQLMLSKAFVPRCTLLTFVAFDDRFDWLPDNREDCTRSGHTKKIKVACVLRKTVEKPRDVL